MKLLIKAYPEWLFGILLCSLTMLTYWAGLSGGFFFDDSVNFLEPSDIRISNFSVESLLRVWESGKSGPLGRPVSMLTFAANYYFSGFEPFVFKLTNLLIHCINGLLVYFLTRLILRSVEAQLKVGDGKLISFLITAIWVLHPIQMTSVLYVVQRMTSISSMFVLLGLLLHIWARQQLRQVRKGYLCLALAWCVVFPLAMLSKETGVLFVGYVFVYEAVLQRKLRSKFDRIGACYITMVFGAGCIALMYLFSSGSVISQGYETRTFTLAQRLMTEARIVWAYLSLIALPLLSDFGLYHDDFELSTGLLSPQSTSLAIAGIAFLAIFASLIRERMPLVAFGVLWFLVGHSVESTLLPLELMHEHRNYLPSLGILIALVAIGATLRKISNKWKILVDGGAVAFLVYMVFVTALRANMYGDDYRRTQIESQYREYSVRSHYDAGALFVNMYNKQPQPILLGMAEKHFERVNDLDSTYKFGLIGMLQLDCLSERKARNAVINELNHRLKNAKWLPLDRSAMHGISEMSNAGTICLNREQVDHLFGSALANPSTKPNDKSVILSDYAAYLWLGQKDYRAALDVLYLATKLNESDTLNKFNLLQLLRTVGDREGVSVIIRELEGMRLNRQERSYFQGIKDQVVADGVLSGVN